MTTKEARKRFCALLQMPGRRRIARFQKTLTEVGPDPGLLKAIGYRVSWHHGQPPMTRARVITFLMTSAFSRLKGLEWREAVVQGARVVQDKGILNASGQPRNPVLMARSFCCAGHCVGWWARPARQSKGAVGAVPVSENKATEPAISKSASSDATSALGTMTFILVARGAFDANWDCATFSARPSTCSASCTKPTLRNPFPASRSRVTVVNISASMLDLLFCQKMVMIGRRGQAQAARQFPIEGSLLRDNSLRNRLGDAQRLGVRTKLTRSTTETVFKRPVKSRKVIKSPLKGQQRNRYGVTGKCD
jgi:hypothetical protein